MDNCNQRKNKTQHSCPQRILKSLDSDDCEVSLYYKDTNQALKNCQKEVTEHEWKFYLNPFSYFPDQENLTVVCPTETHRVQLKGVYSLHLQTNCLVIHRDLTIYPHIESNNPDHEYEAIKIADEPVNLLTPEEMDYLQTHRHQLHHLLGMSSTENINFNLLQTLLKKPSTIVSPLPHHENSSSSIIANVALIISLFTCLLCFSFLLILFLKLRRFLQIPVKMSFMNENYIIEDKIDFSS